MMTAINRLAGFCGYRLVPATDAATLDTLREGGFPLLTRSEAQRIQAKRFRPEGRRVEWRELPELHETGEHEILFCCCSACSDPQSGPLYCGRVARWYAIMSDGSLVAICDEHQKRQRGHLRAIK